MKKTVVLLIIIWMLLPLCGCAGIYSNYREVEQMLVIQTMGLDALPGGVKVSMASSADSKKSGNGPVRITSRGPTVTDAIQNARRSSHEEEIFYAHTGQMLIGEEAARTDFDHMLAYICRSPDVSIDVPVFIVRGGTAEELITSAGDGKKGVSEILNAVIENADDRGDSTIRTAAELVRDLDRHGSSLVCAIECVPSSEQSSGSGSSGEETSGSGSSGEGSSGEESSAAQGSSGGESLTAAVAGYAVIQNGALVGYISREDAVGVGFLTNELGLSDVIVQDETGADVTLEISRGSTMIDAKWDENDALTGLTVTADVTASVIETESMDGGWQAREAVLTERLEREVAARIASVLRFSKRLGADFLGLGQLTEARYPMKFARLGTDMPSLLPLLEIEVSVSARLDHTNDIKDY